MPRSSSSPPRPSTCRPRLAPLAHGRGDPTIRLGAMGRLARDAHAGWTRHRSGWWRAAAAITVSAWGPGAGWVTSNAADLVGANDRPEALIPRHAIIAELVHRLPGLRLPRQPAPVRCPAARQSASRRSPAWRPGPHSARIVRANGEPAPGPGRLRLPPDPAVLAELPYFAFHRFGLERRRAELIRHCAALAPAPGGNDRAPRRGCCWRACRASVPGRWRR